MSPRLMKLTLLAFHCTTIRMVSSPVIIKKGIRGKIWDAINRYLKANNKYMKNYDKDKGSPYLTHCYANNLYGGTMSKFTCWGFYFGLKYI